MKLQHFLTFLCAIPAASLANGGGYLTGIKSTGPFRPVNVDSVEMVSEKLDIDLQLDGAAISIVYQLHNPGAAVDVEMGFPCAVAVKVQYKEGSPDPLPLKSLPQLENFKLTIDGKPVESKLVPDHASLPRGEKRDEQMGIVTGWQVVKLPFAAGQTSTVAVSYQNPYYRDVTYSSDNVYKSAPMMSYLFSAAGLWKGPIKTGEVIVRATGLPMEKVKLSHPKRFKNLGCAWTWNFTDFEPTLQDDLEIVTGETEFHQWVQEKGRYVGVNVRRGAKAGFDERQKTGDWSFLSRDYTAAATSRIRPSKEEAGEEFDEEAWKEAQTALPWRPAKEDGIGESVTLTMNKPVKPARLRIHNGRRGDDESGDFANNTGKLFKEHSRVKKLAVSINGAAPFSVTLPDTCRSEGIVELPANTGEVKTVKLTIEEAYSGTKSRENCITAVELEIPLTTPPAIHRSR